MKFKISIILISIVLVSNVFAAQVREIILDDGSVIYGEVVGLVDNIYEIKTENLGIIEVEGEKVVSIRNKPEGRDISKTDVSNLQLSASSPTDPKAVKAGIEALKRSIGNDAGTMESISDLQKDPDFMAVLNDPEIMSAIESGDIKALTDNPKFLKLLNHPTVRGVGGKVQ